MTPTEAAARRESIEAERAELAEERRRTLGDEDRRKLTGDALAAEGELATLRAGLATACAEVANMVGVASASGTGYVPRANVLVILDRLSK